MAPRGITQRPRPRAVKGKHAEVILGAPTRLESCEEEIWVNAARRDTTAASKRKRKLFYWGGSIIGGMSAKS
jgi:hypothetical protein